MSNEMGEMHNASAQNVDNEVVATPPRRVLPGCGGLSKARFLVHIHIFYPAYWPQLRDALRVLRPYEWDLYVTLVEQHEEIRQQVLQLNPKAHIEVVPNRGYDVAPFLHILDQVDLAQYDFCLKLHTKGNYVPEHTLYEYRSLSVPYKRSGSSWRESLLAPFTPAHFGKIMSAFARDEKLGLVGDHRFIIRRGIVGEVVATDGARELLRRMHLPTERVEWLSGTMFVCRAKLLNPLVKLGLRTDDFAKPDKKHTISLPHMVEVAMGGLIVAQGYSIEDVYTPRWVRALRMLWSYVQIFVHTYIFRTKHTKSNRLLVKVFKIPVYSKKLPPS